MSVYDVGTVGDQVYVAMEFVDGQTLDAWRGEKPRRWQEILEVFAAAGCGLAAAHAANLVHRDFKPQNVMIGRDGRVRVMDFGLARAVLDAPDAPRPSSDRGLPQLLTSTTVGALVGTPAYMAPEQLRGDPIDVRADQFSFCLALHEAIHGARPGVPPQESTLRFHRAPAWLKNVVRRGLEPAPDRRFRSMTALLAAVDRGRTRVHRVSLLFAAVLLLLAATAVGARMSRRREFACVPPQDRIDAVWPPAEGAGSRRAAIHRSFVQSGMDEAWQKVAVLLDDRVRRWADMYRESCEMTHVRGEQSAQVMDLRSACLAETLDETRAYTDRLLLSGLDESGRAIAAANLLDPIQRCADVKGLQMEVPPPRDPRVRAEVERLRQKINDADVFLSTLQIKSALQQLDQVLRAAQTLGYKPLLAQTLQLIGEAQAAAEQFPEADQSFRDALYDAEAS